MSGNYWVDTEFFDRYKLTQGWDEEMRIKAKNTIIAIRLLEMLNGTNKEAKDEGSSVE